MVGFLLWFCAISPVGLGLLRGLESRYNIAGNVAGDVMIVLGAGVYEHAPDLSGVGTPSEEAVGKILAAVRLYRRLHIPVIVSGGKVFNYRQAEAPILKRFLVDLGVPSDQIIMETKSRDTIENAVFTTELCRKFGFTRPILITSAYHMSRSMLSFKKAGIEPAAFPVMFKTWANRHYGWKDFLPDSCRKSRTALREYLGLLFYKLAY